MFHFDAHEYMILQFRNVSVADFKVPNFPLLLPEDVAIALQLVGVDAVASDVQPFAAGFAGAVAQRGTRGRLLALFPVIQVHPRPAGPLLRRRG